MVSSSEANEFNRKAIFVRKAANINMDDPRKVYIRFEEVLGTTLNRLHTYHHRHCCMQLLHEQYNLLCPNHSINAYRSHILLQFTLVFAQPSYNIRILSHLTKKYMHFSS